MYEKIEKSPKKIKFKANAASGVSTSRPSTPPRGDKPKTAGGKHGSPYIDKPPLGYDALYSHTPGKDLEIPTYSPNGTEKKRQKHEGPYHLYLKTGNLTFHEGKIPLNPQKQVHAVVLKSINLSRRFKEDKKIYKSGPLDPEHFRFARADLQETLDLILKVYLACQNRQDYLDSLNKRIDDGEFFNSFQLNLIYKNSTETRFSYQSAHESLNLEVFEKDIKSILFDQLRRLKIEADEDYRLFSVNDSAFTAHAQQTVKFATACMKKIAEFCRFFTAEEKEQFLVGLNCRIRQKKFYHPQVLLSLYLNNCTDYDLKKADGELCYQNISLLDIDAVPEDSMRRLFVYESLTPRAYAVNHTVLDETIETFRKNGALRSRQKRKITTIEGAGFFPLVGEDDSQAEGALDVGGDVRIRIS